ncbi:Het-C-domain-containing protein [Dendrothele bispora CBS 962.96]|uniref:Het-C-domain-containing protein n=1 Tax=Dendrothele bispora (strain CBS 962.96) TaxID=1314807 RepID=A0A4S8MTR0_DENBC|nr:Het-C-domain-containing protein [Dendrothele bispora CBS 962.96]
MTFFRSPSATLFLLTVVLVLLPTETYAFGAGDIPDFSYLSEKAFRHGDIENILSEVAKSAGGAAAGGGLLGFAKKMMDQSSGGSKFSKSDVKKVYFGNWLRDYSQAMDIAGLSKLSADTLVLIVSILGFMAFGFATEEFEVTADRLGVYLPVEHIDNPKGYAEKEGDARQFHPKLRPPVDSRELEIDPRTGMKNYMASEDQGWDTSTAHIKRIFRACIEHGRRSGGEEGADLWEAYRLLGTGLHTMEDLLAHSNWCEIALHKMGHDQVFCHVGDDVVIDTPNGRAPPLVTGTFGGADFMHSMLGEATDHISQASVTALNEKLDDAKNSDSNKFDQVKGILSKLPIGGGDDDNGMGQAEQMQSQSKAYNFNPDDVAPPEVQKQLWDLLKWRDNVYRQILKKIEMVPGLENLLEELSNALNEFVYTTLAPYLTPILTQATGALGEGSKAVIDTEDQYQVFDDPNASDPSHSLLSKDHFGLILNEPAGKIAQVVVINSVNHIVRAWADDGINPDEVIDRILEAFHHPYYAEGRSDIQNRMFEAMEQWFRDLGSEKGEETIQALTKESVREGKNKRLTEEQQQDIEPGYGRRPGQSQGYGQSSGGYGGRQQSQSGGHGGGSGYGGGGYQQQSEYSSGGGGYQQESHGSRRNEYGGGESESYGESRRRNNDDEYGSSRRHEGGGYNPSYGGTDEPRRGGYGGDEGYSGGGYGGGREEGSGYQPSYEQPRREYGSGGGGYDDNERRSGGGYGGGREESGGYQPSYEQPRREHGGGGYGEERRQEYGRGGNGEERRQEYGGGGYGEERRQEYGGGGYGEERRQEYGGGGNEERRQEYGGSRYGEDQPRRREYDGGDEYGGGRRGGDEYGGGRSGYDGGDEYGSSGRGGYGGGEEYGGERRGYGGNDETFGAERMNIRDDNEYGGGGGGYGGEEGYGRRRNEYSDY